jgi:hypothetical protein
MSDQAEGPEIPRLSPTVEAAFLAVQRAVDAMQAAGWTRDAIEKVRHGEPSSRDASGAGSGQRGWRALRTGRGHTGLTTPSRAREQDNRTREALGRLPALTCPTVR